MYEIHPSAADNYNSKVNALIEKLTSTGNSVKQKKEFETEIHVNATITDKDIIGDIEEKISDYSGKVIGRSFRHNGIRYSLENGPYQSLVELSEKIQSQPSFRDRLSNEFIENSIFDWIKKSHINNEQSKDYISHLISLAKKSVQKITIYVPIANLVVEQPFSFCGVIVRNLTQKLIDNMTSISDTIKNDEQRDAARQFFQKFRQKYQGYSAIEIKLECEPTFANKLALMTAQKVTNFLGIYSGALLLPDIKCSSKIRGMEHIEQYTVICFTESNKYNITQGLFDVASSRTWQISKQDLDVYSDCGLGVLSKIATKDKPTEFESLVLNTSILYSKAAFSAEPLEKLVYILSALESTLLKNENEPIQQNLAERLAIFSSSELSERKLIIKLVKSVYSLRSRYLHHGHNSRELDDIKHFFHKVWVFYILLLGATTKFNSKAEFLEAIDDHKLS